MDGGSRWIWEFSEEDENLRREFRLEPGAEYQLLLDYQRSGDRPPKQRRHELTVGLVRLVGPELAQKLLNSQSPVLHVRGPRTARVASMLPFELIFRPEDQDAAVIRLVMGAAPAPPCAEERIVAAYTLVAEDRFLPLHIEAGDLAGIAEATGTPLDELFVCFAGEDFLHATRGASIVHLAGHGRAGVGRVNWREPRLVGALAARHLIDSWAEEPPRLVMLNYCESSNELDAVHFMGSALHATLHPPDQRREDEPGSRISSSLGFDLAAALPTAVVAMRTEVDDSVARRFALSFYRLHLEESLPIAEAYISAVHESGCFDDVGLPVPQLFIGDVSRPDHRPPPSATARSSCLSASDRRHINRYYSVMSPMSQVIQGAWVAVLTGENGSHRNSIVDALLRLEELPYVNRVLPPDRHRAHGQLKEHFACYVFESRVGRTEAKGLEFPVDRIPRSIVLGELMAARGSLGLETLLLLEFAIGQSTILLDAALHAGLDALVEPLEDGLLRLAGKEEITQWALAEILINACPAPRGSTIREWSDSRWKDLEEQGPLAIDLLACIASTSELNVNIEAITEATEALAEAMELDEGQLDDAFQALLSIAALVPGADMFTDGGIHSVYAEPLVSLRARACCSAAAKVALTRLALDRETGFLASPEQLEAVATDHLEALAKASLRVNHPALEIILAELARRKDGAALAADLAGRAGENPTDGDRWSPIERMLQTGRHEEAGELLRNLPDDDPLATPLAKEVQELLIARAKLEPDELLDQAKNLEHRLEQHLKDRTEDSGPSVAHSFTPFLMNVRMVKAEAFAMRGNHEAAAEILAGEFERIRDLGGELSGCVPAGANAVRAFIDAGQKERARTVFDALVEATGDLPPSTAKVMVLTAQVLLLRHEGRDVHASEVAEELIGQLAKCVRPRADVSRGALSVCTSSLDPPLALAIVALLWLVDSGGDTPVPNSEQNRRLTLLARHSDPAVVKIAAAGLAAVLPDVFAAFEVEAERYVDHTESMIHELRRFNW